MKNIQQILCIVVLAVLVLACNKDDAPKRPDPDPIGQPDPDPIPENRPPGSFSLLAVEDNATEVDVLPTFIWEAATDPDGDPVNYDLYIGSFPDSLNGIASDLVTTSNTLSNRLLLNSEYYWQVVARDDKDATIESGIHSFVTRGLNISKTPVAKPGFLVGRERYSLAVFKDTLWLIGGTKSGEHLNDVWFTTNGINWVQAVKSAEFPARSGHRSVAFDNKLWIVGGYMDNGDEGLDDIWFSENGINWKVATYESSFPERIFQSSVRFRDKVFLVGGADRVPPLPYVFYNDVWSSTNGIQYEIANPQAMFSPRGDASLVVFKDMLWLIGGILNEGGGNPPSYEGQSDVWNSSDGINWSQVLTGAPFGKAFKRDCFVFDDKLWLFNGYSLWSSIDGLHWDNESEAFEDFPSLFKSTGIAYNNSIWLLSREGNIWQIN